MVGGLLVFIGVIYLIYKLVSEANIKDVTKNGDFDIDAAFRDSCKVSKGELSRREYKRRTDHGYYNTKKK